MIQLLKVILKNRRLMIIISISAFAVSSVISLILPPRYRVRTLLIPISVERDVTGMQGFLSQLGTFGESFAVYLRARKNYVIDLIIRSRRMSEVLNEKFDLESVYGVDGIDEVRRKLRERTSVYLRNEGVIELTFEDRDRQRALDIVNEYIRNVDSLLIDINTRFAGDRVSFLEREISRREEALSRTDSIFVEFQKEHGMFSLERQAKALMDIVTTLSAELAVLDTEKKLLSMVMKPEGRELEALEARISKIREELDKIKAGSEDSKGLFPSLESFPSLASTYVKLATEVKTQKFVIAYLKLKLEDAKLIAERNVSVLKVLDPPVLPEKRAWPKRKQIVMASTIAAFLWSSFILLLREQLGGFSIRKFLEE